MDNSILKSDIFFFIATIALIIVTALLAAGILYVLTILKLLKAVVKNVKTGTDLAVNEATGIVNQIKNGTFRFSSLLKLLTINRRKSKAK